MSGSSASGAIAGIARSVQQTAAATREQAGSSSGVSAAATETGASAAKQLESGACFATQAKALGVNLHGFMAGLRAA